MSFQSNIMELLVNRQFVNTFASQYLIFQGKNEIFLHENAKNLTHKFLYDNFNKKIYSNFLVKIVMQGEIFHFFSKTRR